MSFRFFIDPIAPGANGRLNAALNQAAQDNRRDGSITWERDGGNGPYTVDCVSHDDAMIVQEFMYEDHPAGGPEQDTGINGDYDWTYLHDAVA